MIEVIFIMLGVMAAVTVISMINTKSRKEEEKDV